MKTDISLKNWHKDEQKWWDKYSDIMNYQWRLTPFLNKLLRQNFEAYYKKFLYMPHGSLLDVGCGSGWLSFYFAEKGMNVLGIDFSKKQIKEAEKVKQIKHARNIKFECVDLIKWNYKKYKNKFDSIFVNAFLHHLPPKEIKIILKNIGFLLKSNGKVFLYEPVVIDAIKKNILSVILDMIFSLLLDLSINKIPEYFKLWIKRYKNEINKGYTGCSPHEAPIDINFIKKNCENSLDILEIKGWNLYSQGYFMKIICLKQPIRLFFLFLAPVWYLLDIFLLSLFKWENFTMPNRFLMCSIKLQKRK